MRPREASQRKSGRDPEAAYATAANTAPAKPKPVRWSGVTQRGSLGASQASAGRSRGLKNPSFHRVGEAVRIPYPQAPRTHCRIWRRIVKESPPNFASAFERHRSVRRSGDEPATRGFWRAAKGSPFRIKLRCGICMCGAEKSKRGAKFAAQGDTGVNIFWDLREIGGSRGFHCRAVGASASVSVLWNIAAIL
jgi:hypothetical protein